MTRMTASEKRSGGGREGVPADREGVMSDSSSPQPARTETKPRTVHRARSRTALEATVRSRAAFRVWFYGLTFSYPLLWILGVAGFYWILLAAGAVGYLVRTQLSRLTWAVLAVPAVLVLSAPIGLIATSADPSRLVGLAANVTVWVATAAVIQLTETADESQSLSRALTLVGLGQGLITMLAVVAYPKPLPIPLLESLAPLVPGGLRAFMENSLYFPSWLDGMAYRSAGMMGQPTWAGAVAMLSLIASLHLLVRARERGLWRWIAICALPMTVLSLNLSLSRAATLGIAIALAAGLMVAVRRLPGPAYFTLVILCAIAGTIVLLTVMPSIVDWAGSVNAQREGSLTTRSEIYNATWQLITHHPFPLLGYGVKPEGAELVAPIATHSTYLGILFRGGILGLALLAVLYLATLRTSVAAASIWATTASVFIIAWSVFEDMDPGHLVPLAIPLAIAWARSEQKTTRGPEGAAGGRPLTEAEALGPRTDVMRRAFPSANHRARPGL